MVSQKGRIRLLLVAFGALVIVFVGSAMVALESVLDIARRVEIIGLKVTGKSRDVTWKELDDLEPSWRSL